MVVTCYGSCGEDDSLPVGHTMHYFIDHCDVINVLQPDGRIFTPPTTVTVESRKQRCVAAVSLPVGACVDRVLPYFELFRVSSSPSRSRQARNMSPTRTLTVDPSLYIQRSMMIHGVRGDGDERLQHAAQAHANEQYVCGNRLTN